MTLSPSEAHAHATEWIAAWNAHDLDRILSHYTDDFTMSSPYIPLLADEPTGVLRGRAAVGAYWAKALQRVPDLHFTLLGVHVGVDSLALYYHSTVRDRTVVEVLTMAQDGRYRAGHAYNAVPKDESDAAPSSIAPRAP